MGGAGYYRKFLPDLSKRIRPLTALLRKGLGYVFTPAMEIIARRIPNGLRPSQACTNKLMGHEARQDCAQTQFSSSVSSCMQLNDALHNNEPKTASAIN